MKSLCRHLPPLTRVCLTLCLSRGRVTLFLSHGCLGMCCQAPWRASMWSPSQLDYDDENRLESLCKESIRIFGDIQPSHYMSGSESSAGSPPFGINVHIQLGSIYVSIYTHMDMYVHIVHSQKYGGVIGLLQARENHNFVNPGSVYL